MPRYKRGGRVRHDGFLASSLQLIVVTQSVLFLYCGTSSCANHAVPTDIGHLLLSNRH